MPCFVIMTVSMIAMQIQKWVGQSLIDKIIYKNLSFNMFNCLNNGDEGVLYFEQVIARTAFFL